MVLLLEAVLLSTFMMLTQQRANDGRRIIADRSGRAGRSQPVIKKRDVGGRSAIEPANFMIESAVRS